MIGEFFRRVWAQNRATIHPLPPNTDFSNKTILLTGGSAGLGYECALQLLQAKTGRLILPVRNLTKGEAVRTKLLNDPIVKSQNPDAIVELFSLEMEDFESVTALPEALKQAGIHHLDIAILNAGVLRSKKVLTKSGHEGTIQVNHLSTILLAILLLPYLRATSKLGNQANLTMVNSSNHDYAVDVLAKELPNPNIHASLDSRTPAKYEPTDYYNLSKLLNMFLMCELAARVSPDEVIINTVNPGFCNSDLGREMKIILMILQPVLYFLQRSMVDGARCFCQAATGGKGMHGIFWDNGGAKPMAPMITEEGGKELQKRLWDETMAILKPVFPGLATIIKIYIMLLRAQVSLEVTRIKLRTL